MKSSKNYSSRWLYFLYSLWFIEGVGCLFYNTRDLQPFGAIIILACLLRGFAPNNKVFKIISVSLLALSNITVIAIISLASLMFNHPWVLLLSGSIVILIWRTIHVERRVTEPRRSPRPFKISRSNWISFFIVLSSGIISGLCLMWLIQHRDYSSHVWTGGPTYTTYSAKSSMDNHTFAASYNALDSLNDVTHHLCIKEAYLERQWFYDGILRRKRIKADAYNLVLKLSENSMKDGWKTQYKRRYSDASHTCVLKLSETDIADTLALQISNDSGRIGDISLVKINK